MELTIITAAQAKELGLRKYYTGIPCSNGHLSERCYPKMQCLSCKYEQQKKWRLNNRDKCREYSRASYKRHKTNTKKYEYYKMTPEQKAEIKRDIRKRSREKRKEQIALSTKLYKAKNREKIKAQKQNRRARISSADGRHSGSDINRIFKMQNYKCAYCGISIKKGYHIDHIIPIALGGSNWPNNIQLTCQKCNLSKGRKDPIKFAQQIGRLI